jgi:hypothetical protein
LIPACTTLIGIASPERIRFRARIARAACGAIDKSALIVSARSP